MFAFIKEKYFGLLDDLDFLSSQVRRYTYDFQDLINIPCVQQKHSRRSLLTEAAEVTVVFLFLLGLTIFSRDATFDTMFNAMSDYFLPGLVNVSTTHDSGYYMQLAREWQTNIRLGQGILDVQPGFLLPYIIAKVAEYKSSTLEEAAMTLVYFSGIATSFITYLFFRSLRQGVLGIFVAASMIFIWPIYARIGIGMIDTELINLLFLIGTLSILWMAIKARSLQAFLVLTAMAGIINHLLYLNYSRSGFTLIFVISYLGAMAAERKSLKQAALGLLTLLLFSGYDQITTMWSTMAGFLGLYVFRQEVSTVLATQQGFSGESFRSLFYPTISEIQRFSTSNVINDFGSPPMFWLGMIGTVVFVMSDWKRVFLFLPMIAFLLLYFLSGQRFAYYAAPLIIAGMFCGVGVGLKLAARGMLSIDNDASKKLVRTGDEAAAPERNRTALNWKSTALASVIFGSLWLTGVFHPVGIASPPVIKATQLSFLKSTLPSVEQQPTVVTWWDYGYEVKYQVQADVLVTGGNPANVKNVYLARALSTMDPFYAADEIRFAAYFSERDLTAKYPQRPDIRLASGTQKDLYVFLPSDLQLKMFTIYQIAEKTLQQQNPVGYDPQKSAFFTLYHNSPAQWGPFEFVGKRDGAVIYRLPSPR